MDPSRPVPHATHLNPVRRANLAVQRCRTRHAPDGRVSVFDLRIEPEPLRLTGVVSTDYLRQRALDAARGVLDEPVASDVTVLDTIATPVTTDERAVAVRSDPDPDAERVTELRYGAAASAFDATEGWRRVRVPDGYVGWVDDERLRDPVAFDPDGFVRSDDLAADGVTLPLATECERIGDDRVRLRTGTEVAVDATDVDLLGAAGEPSAEHFGATDDSIGESVVAHARRYRGTPYRWGGTTDAGIDCSGLVWVAYFRHSVVLPRDTDQQRCVGEPVPRDALEPGDLLFFPGHVAISTGGLSFVHAYGAADEVTENSLDPGADDYTPGLDESFDCARRVC